MKVQTMRLVAAAAFLSGAAVGLPAQQPATSGPNLRLEGSWVRLDVEGSGSFGGLTSKFTPAALTPEAAARGAAGRGVRPRER